MAKKHGTNFTAQKITTLRDLNRIDETEYAITEQVFSFWQKGTRFFHKVIVYTLLNNEVLPQLFKDAFTDINHLSETISFYPNHMLPIAQLYTALNSINTIYERLHEEQHKNSIRYEWNNKENAIMIEDLKIAFPGSKDNANLLLDILQLNLTKGIYAIDGASGSGKSTLLAKLFGIENDLFHAQGQISYPIAQKDDIVFLTQNNYIPLDSTLLEIVLYPYIPENIAEYYDKVYSLLFEIGIDDRGGKDQKESLLSHLNSKLKWHTVISDGQLAKIDIVSAIIKQPKILLADEIFRGLDHKSLCIAQHMIKKYLPDIWGIFVDHHLANHNYNNFFLQTLHLQNKTLVSDTPPETIEIDCPSHTDSYPSDSIAKDYSMDIQTDIILSQE